MSESSPSMSALPLRAGTVTLLLGDVEGSTRLWETSPDDMRRAVAALGAAVDAVCAAHGGVRPVEQGEGDSFLLAFDRAVDAVAAALELQGARCEPIRLRIGVHTGDVELRDDGRNVTGPAVNRCARLRDIASGGQTVLSQTTVDIVADHSDAELVDLGVHRLRDLARPEHVWQLGAGDFPALRSLDAYHHNLPVQLTTFIGRDDEIARISEALEHERLVTLTGSGGAGKTRLALHVGADRLGAYADGVFVVDLAPIFDADVVPSTTAKALDVSDEPSVPVIETLERRLSGRQLLCILDNCEHLIDACAELVDRILRACPGITFIATSREPLGISGERTIRVPSMSPSASVKLFVDRASRARSGFELTADNEAAVADICRRLDGIPLAIELAAARTRAVSPERIAVGLNDRFRLLSGASRTAVQRQQTLRASIDWSHDLLTEPDRLLFRRLAVFAGSFDFEAAVDVGSGDGLEEHQVIDQLTSLVDKSLVLIDDEGRYRMLETVRQYAADHLTAAGEADAVRRRHRDHYLALCVTAQLGMRSRAQHEWIPRLEREIDNIRAACDWSLDVGDRHDALRLVLPLCQVWRVTGQWREPVEWFEDVLMRCDDAPVELRVDALIDALRWNALAYHQRSIERATEVVELARSLNDPARMARALRAAGYAFIWTEPERTIPFATEAAELARSVGDEWTLSDALSYLGYAVLLTRTPGDALPILGEAFEIAERIGNTTRATMDRAEMVATLTALGRLDEALGMLDDLNARTHTSTDRLMSAAVGAFGAWPLTLHGDLDRARVVAEASHATAEDLVGFPFVVAQDLQLRGVVHFAMGDVDAARALFRSSWERAWVQTHAAGLPTATISTADTLAIGVGAMLFPLAAEADLAAGDLAGVRRWLDFGARRFSQSEWARAWLTLVGARLAFAEGDVERADDVAREALGTLDAIGARVGVVDALELLADLSHRQESHAEAARLVAGASTARSDIGYVRFRVYDTSHATLMAGLNAALGDEFDRVWSEGAALSLDEAVAYARRGRGERKRPSTGWASLTPTELDVARLIGEGLSNKDVAAKLFISHRTVQAHLSHIYAKLGITSRVQLATEATRR